MNNRTYLIAGGAGFVGSNLARRLLNDGAHVHVVDNLVTGRMANLDELAAHPRFSFTKLDIIDSEACAAVLRKRYTHVFNLACPTGVPNIARLGEEMLLVSSAGVQNLLKVVQRTKAKFLFASTAEAYGDPEVFPQAETYTGNVDPVGPRSPYEEGKRFGEALTRFVGGKYGVHVTIVRIFNTYGPRMSPHDQRVIPQMLANLIDGRGVPIFGDGSQTRSFLHVDDLVEGLITVMDDGAAGEVYNIGGSSPITILDLFKLVKSATGLKGRSVLKKHFISDHRGRQPDVSKVRALGWEAKVSMEDGIRESYRDMLEAKAPAKSRPAQPMSPPAVRLPGTLAAPVRGRQEHVGA